MSTNEAGDTLDSVAADDHSPPAGEFRRGYLTGPGMPPQLVDYEVIGDRAVYGGCIELGTVAEVEALTAQIDAELATLRDNPIGGDGGPSTALSIGELGTLGVGLPTHSAMLWPNGRVAYTFHRSLVGTNRVGQAIRHIEENTAIRFTRRTNGNAASWPNWIEFRRHEDQNLSPIGMRGNGRQIIHLTDTASVGTVIHEILHSLGIRHEHQRSDRDDFVEIRWQNIKSDAVRWFGILTGSTNYFDYDYASVMHYGRRAFSRDRDTLETIVPRRAGVTIGQRNGLSFGDRQTVAKLYERFFTTGYSGLWRQQTSRYGLWAEATRESFLAKWNEWSALGYRLVDLHTRRVGNQTRYTGIFVEGSGPSALWLDAPLSGFTEKRLEFAAQGLRLKSVHVHRVGNQDRYSGAFVAGSGGHGFWAGATFAHFEAKRLEWQAEGLRLADLHVHRVNGQTRYTGVFEQASSRAAFWADSSFNAFRQKWVEWHNQGMRLVDLAIHRHNGTNRYSGVWHRGGGGERLWVNVTFEGLRAKLDEWREEGFRLVDYDFPAAEIGAPGQLMLADALEAGDVEATGLDDPHLTLDGFGGLFDERPSVGEERPSGGQTPDPAGIPAVDATRNGEVIEAGATAVDGIGSFIGATEAGAEVTDTTDAGIGGRLGDAHAGNGADGAYGRGGRQPAP